MDKQILTLESLITNDSSFVVLDDYMALKVMSAEKC